MPGVLHIPNLARNLIYVRKMYVVGGNIVCGDGGCKMVQGSMVLIRGFQDGTLYKLLGRNIIIECNSSIVLDEGGKDDRTLSTSGGKKFIWNQRLGNLREKGIR